LKSRLVTLADFGENRGRLIEPVYELTCRLGTLIRTLQVFMANVAPFPAEQMLFAIQRVHHRTQAAVIAACESQSFEELCGEATAAAGDTVYAIDRIAEEVFLAGVTEEIAVHAPVIVIGEGVPGGQVVLPIGAIEQDAPWRLIADPIDGTRGLMFQKRSAWILTGAARNDGAGPTLAEIEIAVQTELPLVKQHLCDSFWAMPGQGVHAERWNRITDKSESFIPQPSTATTVTHGFATVCSFFAGGRDIVGSIADELSRRLLAGNQPGEARIFDDQYACTGGQIAGLLTGQDRFVADLRPMLLDVLQKRGDVLGHCCHPYDLCTKLIAEEAGIHICLPDGKPIDVPLDTETNVTWVGYANPRLRELIEPVLQSVMHDILT
jgi:fructose-1,6-bisphosphatase/inositol monophosphatase family enzyme